MSRLALTLPLQEGETPASFAARLAYRNRTKPRDFCSDMGLRWPHVCSGHSDQLRRLAYLSGASFERLELASARFLSPSRYQVGLSSATSGTFRRAITRVCPTCVLDAMERHGEAGPFQNLEWLLLCVTVCRLHQTTLLQLPNADHAHKTYDIVHRTLSHWECLRASCEQAATRAPTLFENYVCDRIWFPAPKSWLSDWDLTDLHHGSLALGMAMNFGASRLVSSLNENEVREATNSGFRILIRGGAALLRTLDAFRQRYSTERPYFSKDMGPFYVWLKEGKDNPRLAKIRKCVEQFILDKYPLQVGKSVLSKQMVQPKYMTLNQVREVHGIGHVRVRSILARIKKQSPAAMARVMDVSHSDLQLVLSFWRSLQNISSAAETLGIRPDQIKALLKLGVLSGCNLGSSLTYVDRSSVQELLAKVEATPVLTKSKHRLSLKAYCQTQHIPLAQVVSLWNAGQLENVYRKGAISGLPSLMIPNLVRRCLPERQYSGDLTLPEAAGHLRIGIKSIRKLGDNGLLHQVAKINSDTQRRKKHISQESIREFEARYVTLGQIAHETGRASIHVARWLDRNQVETIDCESGYVRVYEQAIARDVIQILQLDRK
ncbi:MAG: TniQ family protein [Pseudomonadota bacterium]